MSVNTDLCNDFLDAMQIITTSSVEKAGYDKTIQAQILSCEDATIGKYRCRYQDATIYAYSGSSDITFTKGAYVYILVPGGDMSNEKTILGTTKKLGINYISQAEGDQAYNLIGNNCVISSSENKFYLDTLNRDYKYKIYNINDDNQQTELDITALEQYIKESSSLIIGATFKTNIAPERQYRGHYGITYNLRFLDNTSDKEVIRSYTVDEDNMIDNPYRLAYNTRQYQIFDIDGPNFIRVESIQIFNSDFPGADKDITDVKLDSGDIEISNLELFGATRMTENEINGVAISFYTPRGTFFPSNAPQGSYVTITAQVRIKGKLASVAQNIQFYWGEEDVSISPKHDYYNKYLGRGWRCLNDRNVITQQSAEGAGDAVVEWVPGSDTYILKLEDAIARNNKFKVAIIYDDSVVAKEINIQNLNQTSPLITIESDGGNKFYYDIGHPNLVCKINGITPENYQYHWAYENNKGVLEILPPTTQQNDDYHEKVNQLNELKEAIAAGSKFANAEKNNLLEFETAVNAFNFIQRVEGNQVHDVQINNITQFGIFKCSVYDQFGRYLGTGSITLTNGLDTEDNYSLVINNGSTVFQYNENGVAPNSKSLDSPQELQALSFTVYNNLGQAIDSNLIINDSNCKVRWEYPKVDTLLEENKENGNPSGNDPTNSYWYYDNRLNLLYDIATKYDIKKQHNQIKLTVDYKGMNLVAETDFTFAKQGQPGTNGTQYLVKLVPRTLMDNPPLWPMITRAGSKYFLNYGLGSEQQEQEIGIGTNYQFFKAQLWRSGVPVWQGLQVNPDETGEDGYTKPTVVNWQILANQYKAGKIDNSLFTVANAANGTFKFNGIDNVNTLSNPYANIIKCSITWQGKTYYGTMPVTVAWTSDEKYRISLKDYTGWRYAIYTNDGVLPQYDSSHPFEFIMDEKINDIWEDISLVSGNHRVTFDTPVGIGNYKDTGSGSEIDANLIQILTSDAYKTDAKNKWNARPTSRYDGLCVNAAIVQTCKNRNGQIIGRISVPIHFLLNKYGMSNINAWDGNSVQLDNEGGFVLAPQVGAGKKENDNSFTGVLMGQTRIPNKSTPQIGLLGYASGDRTFFLNSKNGSALFGKNDDGQIIIDPNGKALLYSHNFWKNYHTDDDNDGLPTSYTYRNNNYKPSGNGNGQGMIIDLSTPQIFFGNGDFYVNEEGHVHAGGGGDIGGWVIGDNTLQSNNKTITLDSSGDGKIYSGSHSTLSDHPVNGFYLASDGFSIGSKAKLTNEGVLYLGRGATKGSGTFWTINGAENDGHGNRSYIAYGVDSTNNYFITADSDKTTTSKVYLGTDGFSLGKRFSVSNSGYLTAYKGDIGGWSIDQISISSSGIQLLSSGYIQTANFNANNNADGWQITSTGAATFKNLIASNRGFIGGWQIGATTLTGGSLTLNSGGSMSGPTWSINSDGKATFSNAEVAGIIVKGQKLSGEGMSMGGAGSGGSSINPGGVGYGGNSGIGVPGSLGDGLFRAYKGEFDELYAKVAEIDDLWIRSRLKYNNHSATWGAVAQSVSVSGSSASVTVDGNEYKFVKSITVTLTRTHGLVDGVGADTSSGSYTAA